MILDSCDGVKCNYYSTCVPRSFSQGVCTCPICDNDKDYNPVCADDGFSYANLCRMKKHACLIQKMMKPVKYEACGMFDVSVLYF